MRSRPAPETWKSSSPACASSRAVARRSRPSFSALGKPAIGLHPKAAEEYRCKVETIQQTLNEGDAEARVQGIAAIRTLIVEVTVFPTPRRLPVKIEIEGELAALLESNEPETNVGGRWLPGLEATYTEHGSTTREDAGNSSKSWARRPLRWRLARKDLSTNISAAVSRRGQLHVRLRR
jgi:hypothetical protein